MSSERKAKVKTAWTALNRADRLKALYQSNPSKGAGIADWECGLGWDGLMPSTQEDLMKAMTLVTPDKLEQRARKAAEIIGADIADRRGLKWEWRQVDDDIREQILQEWTGIILADLRQAVEDETADLVKHLEWALQGYDGICCSCADPEFSNGIHEDDCPYAAAIAAIHRARGQK